MGPLFFDCDRKTMAASMQERFGNAHNGEEPMRSKKGGDKNVTSLDSVLKRLVDYLTPDDIEYEDIVWFNVFFLLVVHIAALYGLTLAFTAPPGLGVMWPLSGMGITIGVHRLWSHKSFKAHWSVRAVLAAFNSMAYQGSIYEWSRDHRVHHMKSETNGDPYNFNRGWIFAHIGWVMLRKHPDVIAAGKKLDFSDLKEDAIVMLQHKPYLPSVVLFCYALPTAVGWYFTNQIWASFFILGVFRHLFVLHCTWCVNSLAHAIGHGYRPYNDKINPAENLLVSILALGEGWHNYHHQYPTDYRAAEGTLWQFAFNPSTLVIDSLAAVGLVWDRRSTSRSIVEKHKAKVLAATTKAE